MTSTPLETELMHRALHEIDQLLSALQATATVHHCLPRDEFSAAPFERPGAEQAPTPSAVYFCLASASALLDVSRSLLGHLDVLPANTRPANWSQLSEASKAAGQSAFLASVMLASPQAGSAGPTSRDDMWAPTRAGRPSATAARPQGASVGMRLKTRLRSLIDAVAV
ncbi:MULTISPECIES: hypothetical protein [unclassified Variovorax]|uniref:hypothetical protein n=1 Tax=unclassified Variovorax TaxID=663243 RepID=UPI00076D5829|nr:MULTISPECIES: hypothetical protein [unclassified Variovorax]KWT87257.1 hypothetical protein APY03_3758 [Variovorax sp. WDL1]PNG51949.1 hypothetical protein CHC07_04319 [Variovorax sp. B4]PNG54489.1 hypothetical protein CHC06_03285 [Variovorax sp. B2]VTV15451.1 hypothetical protein WDL1CHR_05857 [Variovorax sp. WDL1]